YAPFELVVFKIQILCNPRLSVNRSPVRCCTKYSSQPFPVLRLKDFTRQDATMTCNIEAVIFTTVKNRQICANPDDLWVQNAVLHIL
uniref:Chemokine interleukin-8-like domain-containing protein n=1 Tax=Sinocyclocheilus grahami TaxID=75366 RepID=A0A672RTI8_SINGR